MYGVDGYMPYLNSNLCRGYDVLVRADVFEVVNERIKIDVECVLCMDVVEHLEKEDAERLMGWLLGRKRAYMSTPLFWMEQDPSQGNELERHKCFFQESDLVKMGWKLVSKVAWGDLGHVGAFRNG
jgi:hypothetical protein